MTTVVQQVRVPCTSRFSRATLEDVAGPASLPAADEPALARRAAAGDGEAFATLYERYEKRTYNLCYRILGSQDDAADAAQEAFVSVLRRLPKLEGRELAFGSYLFTSARNACYDLIARHKRTEPSDEIPEYADAGGRSGRRRRHRLRPGRPGGRPRAQRAARGAHRGDPEANLSLPERQREVLALKELEDLSYDEIAEIMGMNRNSVAQLISRARINLRSALQGTALASIASTSPDCERALPLIAAQQDSQLPDDSADADWLGDHLMSCDACRLGREAMEEAGLSYRAWLPIGAGPLLFRETMAEASEVVGADWSETIARREAKRSKAPANGAGPGMNGRPGGRTDPSPPAAGPRAHGGADPRPDAGGLRGPDHRRRSRDRRPSRLRRGAGGHGGRPGAELRRAGEEEAPKAGLRQRRSARRRHAGRRAGGRCRERRRPAGKLAEHRRHAATALQPGRGRPQRRRGGGGGGGGDEAGLPPTRPPRLRRTRRPTRPPGARPGPAADEGPRPGSAADEGSRPAATPTGCRDANGRPIPCPPPQPPRRCTPGAPCPAPGGTVPPGRP